MNDKDHRESRAKRRLIALSLVRAAGMILTILGLQIWQEGALGLHDETLGKVVTVGGVACVFLLPALLRRRWREAP